MKLNEALKSICEECGYEESMCECGNEMEEVAPPGKKYEKMIKRAKQQYGADSDIPFKIAWSAYNKERGK
tara:strand:+ start:2101 stop:2310 length:210 start_codon:yes stop_codon:yes gene_type:complete